MLPSASSMVWETMRAVWVELSGGRKTAPLPWQREETATEGVGTCPSTALLQYLALRMSSILQALTLVGTVLPGQMWGTGCLLPHLPCGKSHFQSHLQGQSYLQTQVLHTKISSSFSAIVSAIHWLLVPLRCSHVLPNIPGHTTCLLISFDDVLLFIVRVQGFAWVTCGSKKSPERQTTAEIGRCRIRLLLCIV